MASIAAQIDSDSRQRLLGEMGIEPMHSKCRGDADATTRCLILVPSTARGDGPRERLLQRIVAAANLPEDRCTLLWLQPGVGTAGLPTHSCCLVFGVALSAAADEPAWQLPSVQELLDKPEGKRQVWHALVEVRRRLLAEE